VSTAATRLPHIPVKEPVQNDDNALDDTAIESLVALERRGNKGFFSRVLQSYMDETPRLLAELDRALRDNNAEAAKAAAHTLKSSSAQVGAERLSGLCEVMGNRLHRRECTSPGQLLERMEAEYEAVRDQMNLMLERSKR